ncbi:hypothetical protein ABEO66_30000 [Bacillus pacificus]|uniref:alpha/beta hydrolase n=1 Tax=Bacillus pacificus TaxID=2026187 RepID=UPI003D1E9692
MQNHPSTYSWIPPESSAYVGYTWNAFLPAFKGIERGKSISLPYKPTPLQPPTDYQGDYYIDEFSDLKIKEQWNELKVTNPKLAQSILANVNTIIALQFRTTGTVDPFGKIDPHQEVNLRDIRRPIYFGSSPLYEEIAALEEKTYTVEFTVPKENASPIRSHDTLPIKLRGWFIKGDGIPIEQSHKIHALVIFNAGASIEITAMQHPQDPLYKYNVMTKEYERIPYPNANAQTENWGTKQWRQFLYAFHKAGFDVLAVDKRGHGISGGITAISAGDMAEDQFLMLDQLQSGHGLRILTPDGETLVDDKAAGVLIRHIPSKEIPVIIGGASQGSIIASFVMQKNFVGWKEFTKLQSSTTVLPKKYNIKAAVLLGDLTGGIGYNTNPDLLNLYLEGAFRIESGIMTLPSSEVLANVHAWPAVFLGKGMWDEFQSAEGTFEVYRRANSFKKLLFVRGPHSQNAWGPDLIEYVTKKMIKFSVRSITNPRPFSHTFKSLKEAILNSPPYWEPSSRP